jgi:serine/threonine protein kinase
VQSDSDPPIHFCLSDKDVFIVEETGGSMRVTVGGFGVMYMLAGQTYADVLGESGFVDPTLLSANKHFFNTVSDRNHGLASEATDVFSFGMVLRSILSLKRPFEGEGNANDFARQGSAAEIMFVLLLSFFSANQNQECH